VQLVLYEKCPAEKKDKELFITAIKQHILVIQQTRTDCYSFIVPLISAAYIGNGKLHEEKPESG
jgi:hypothetical protein